MLLMTKLKNELRALDGKYEFHLRNTQVNGAKRGCSGFVVNPANGNIAYVDTESSVYAPIAGKSLVRTASSLGDYRGGVNRFVPEKDTAAAVHAVLTGRAEKIPA